MFDSFITDKSKDLLLLVFISLVIIRVGGFSFLFRLVLRVLRVDFRCDKLKKHNDQFYDAQMYRLLNGINVACTEDAVLIEENISNGKFKRSSFWFTGFFGPIGHKRLVRIEIAFISVIFIVSIVFGAFLLISSAYNHQKGYVAFSFENETLYISPENIYDKTKKIKTNKEGCNKYKDTAPNIYTEACEYLTPTSKENSETLNNEIAKERRNILTFTAVGFGFMLIALMLLGGFIQYISLNKIICDIKDSLGNNGS